MKATLFLLGSLMLSACAGRNIDIGEGEAGAGARRGGTTGNGDGQVGPPRAVWPDPNGCVDAGTSPITGTWKGYIEFLPAPWDTLVLDIRGASETGGVCGTMTIGTGDSPPPPTQRDVGYPPGVVVSGLTPVVEGFAYTLLEATLKEGRVLFERGRSQPWREWCALQIAEPDEHNDSGYSCTGLWMRVLSPGSCTLEEPGSGKRRDVDCAWLQLTQECHCYADGCEAGPWSRDTFDLHFNGDEADGSAYVLPASSPTTPKRARFFRSK